MRHAGVVLRARQDHLAERRRHQGEFFHVDHLPLDTSLTDTSAQERAGSHQGGLPVLVADDAGGDRDGMAAALAAESRLDELGDTWMSL